MASSRACVMTVSCPCPPSRIMRLRKSSLLINMNTVKMTTIAAVCAGPATEPKRARRSSIRFRWRCGYLDWNGTSRPRAAAPFIRSMSSCLSRDCSQLFV